MAQTKQRALLQHGSDSLCEIFDIRPRFFVPPYDDISHRNIKLVIQKGMISIYGQENIHRFFKSIFVAIVVKRFVAKRIFKKFARTGFIIPVSVGIIPVYIS